jgi:hypothetical protein
MLGAGRIQCINEWRVPKTTLLLEGLSTHRIKPHDWKCPGCWAKVITAKATAARKPAARANTKQATRPPPRRWSFV